MDRFIWRVLMWLWVRRAKAAYSCHGERGELFCTAGFQKAVGRTTGQSVGETTARIWLIQYGLTPGYGHAYWFASDAEAEKTYPAEKR